MKIRLKKIEKSDHTDSLTNSNYYSWLTDSEYLVFGLKIIKGDMFFYIDPFLDQRQISLVSNNDFEITDHSVSHHWDLNTSNDLEKQEIWLMFPEWIKDKNFDAYYMDPGYFEDEFKWEFIPLIRYKELLDNEEQLKAIQKENE